MILKYLNIGIVRTVAYQELFSWESMQTCNYYTNNISYYQLIKFFYSNFEAKLIIKLKVQIFFYD